MTLAEKIDWLEEHCNELAFGWNDSGCFWHLQIGPRGAGNMLDGFGRKYSAVEANTFEEAVDYFIARFSTDLRITNPLIEHEKGKQT